MIALIPLITDDRILLLLFLGFSVVRLWVRRSKSDMIFFCFGVVVITAFEYLFISTGVETFERKSLFGLMPLWLPVLWGYGFVAIRNASLVLNSTGQR